jgi:hypothetical protein
LLPEKKRKFFFTKLLVAKDSACPVRRRNPSCKPGDLKLSLLEKQNCKRRKRNPKKKTRTPKNKSPENQKKKKKKTSYRKRRKPNSTNTKQTNTRP